MTDREWRDVADELEEMANQWEEARPEFRDFTGSALVSRVRMLINIIRDRFKGH